MKLSIVRRSTVLNPRLLAVDFFTPIVINLRLIAVEFLSIVSLGTIQSIISV